MAAVVKTAHYPSRQRLRGVIFSAAVPAIAIVDAVRVVSQRVP